MPVKIVEMDASAFTAHALVAAVEAVARELGDDGFLCLVVVFVPLKEKDAAERMIGVLYDGFSMKVDCLGSESMWCVAAQRDGKHAIVINPGV
jgi:hypothetical protein